MSAAWDNGSVAHDSTFWAEALRVAKPGAFLLTFGGTRTYHRLACAIEDAGWELRDMLNWLQGAGFPKSKSCLKPAHEPIVLAKAPGPLQPLQIDACRVPTSETVTCSGQGFRTGADRGRRTYGASALASWPWRSAPGGRWPPNLVLSHVPPAPDGTGGCRSAGVRRVRAAGWRDTDKRVRAPGWRLAGDGRDEATQHYADADGFEQVPSWECVGPSETTIETFTLPDGSCVDPMAAGFRLLVAALEDVQARLRHSHSGDMVLCDAARRDLAALEVPGFQDDCPACRHSYGAHARLVKDAARESAQRLADALECVLDQGRSPLHSLQYLPGVHLSSSDGSRGESTHGDKAASKNGRDHGCASLPALAGHIAHTSPAEQPRSVPHGSTPSNNSERSDVATASTPCHSTCSGVGFRMLSRLVLHCASWYLPLHSDTQTIAQAGCPVKALDEQAGPRTSTRSARGGASGNKVYGRFAPATRYECGYDDSSTAVSRFFPTFAPEPEDAVPFRYCAKASRSERDAGLADRPARRGEAEQFNSRWKEGTGNLSQPLVRNGHPTVKPIALMQWLCRLVCPNDGLVLDPFAGSGSTGVACVREGLHYLLIEQDAGYVEIAQRRIAHAQEQQAGPLFAGVGGG